MTTKTNPIEVSVVEPLFDAAHYLGPDTEVFELNGRHVPVDAAPDHLKATAAEAVDAMAAVAPHPHMGQHYFELSREIGDHAGRGRLLLFRFFQAAFQDGIWLYPSLVVPQPGSAWNEGEIARYQIRVRNATFFDVESLRLRLTVHSLDDIGSAEIVDPAGSQVEIGDLPAAHLSQPAEFQVRAVDAGDVQLRLRAYGKVAPMRSMLIYDGFNPGRGTYRGGYRQAYSIFPN